MTDIGIERGMPTLTVRTVRVGEPDGRACRRSTNPLTVLSRQHDELCNSAVDPWEIAAGLEAEGMSDVACHRYGYPDVFSLAEALFVLVPRRGASRTGGTVRPPVSRSAILLRGLIYALPGLVSVEAMRQTQATAVLMLLLGLSLGWGLSQALSYLGYRSLGWDGIAAAQRVLRAGLLAGVLLVVVVLALVAVLVAAPAAAVLAAMAVGAYMIGAGVLLVLGRDRLLLAALAPGSLAGLLLLLGLAPWARPGQLALAAASVLAVLVMAVVVTAAEPVTHAHTDATTLNLLLTPADLRAAGPHVLYGMLCAGAVGLAPLTLAVLAGRPASAIWYAALPLVLSMGAVEWQLSRLRSRVDSAMRESTTPQRFARRAQSAFARAIVEYLAVVAVLGGITVVAARDTIVTGLPLLVLGYSVLAACFFVTIVLVSISQVRLASICIGSALAVYLLAVRVSATQAEAAYVFTFGAILVVLLVAALRHLRSPLVHL